MLKLLALSPCLLSAAVVAQTLTVVPATARTPDGDYMSSSLFYGNSYGANAAHTQALYATGDLGLVSGLIHGLSFRRTTNAPAPTLATTAHLHIEMSVSPAAPAAASATFAQNHGSNRTVVFDGDVVLPATPAPGVWPASWETPIVFPTPFAYDGNLGNSLVIDVVTTGNNQMATWYAAGAAIGYGTMQTVYASGSCRTNDGSYSGSFGYRQFQPYVGGPFSLSLLGYPDRRPSFASSVLMFGFGGPGTAFGNGVLPLSLAALGLPANAPCMLAITPDAFAPIAYNPGSSNVPGSLSYGPLTLPNSAYLVGMSFLTQALSVDYENSMPEPMLFPSTALRWRIGTGIRPAASQVVRFGDSNPPNATGTVEADQAPVFGIDLR